MRTLPSRTGIVRGAAGPRGTIGVGDDKAWRGTAEGARVLYLRPVLRRLDGWRRGGRRGELPPARPRVSGCGDRGGARLPPSGPLPLLPRRVPRPRPFRRG